RDRKVSAARNRRPDVESSRGRDRPREVGDARTNRRYPVAPESLTSRVAHTGRTLELELAQPKLVVLDGKIGEPRREPRNFGHRIALAGSHQREILELTLEIGPHTGARVYRDLQGRAHAAAIEHDRRIGRQIEPRQCQIKPSDDSGSLEMDRVEPEPL